MCQEEICRLLEKYGDSFDKAFFRIVENLLGHGKKDSEILALAREKSTDKKITFIRTQGHIVSDKTLDKWLDYFGASHNEIQEFKVLTEYFRKLKKLKKLSLVDINVGSIPKQEVVQTNEQTVRQYEQGPVVHDKEPQDANVRVLDVPHHHERSCCVPNVKDLIMDWNTLFKFRHQLNDPVYERLLEFVNYVSDSLEDFAKTKGLEWDWFKNNVDKGVENSMGDTKQLMLFLREKLGFSGEVAYWITFGKPTARPIRILSEEYRAAISSASQVLALKTNGSSGS